MRLATDGVVGQRESGDPLLRGMADSSIGFKYKIVDESEVVSIVLRNSGGKSSLRSFRIYQLKGGPRREVCSC